MFTPQQINEITFKKARFGGYDMASVDEILEPLTNDYISLYNENNTLRSKLRVLAKRVEEQRADDAHGKATAENAKKIPEAMIREAEVKCSRMLNDAKSSAAGIINEAKSTASGIINDARSSSNTIVNEAKAFADEILRNADQSAQKAPAPVMVGKTASEQIAEIQAQMKACIEALEQIKATEEKERAEAIARANRTGKASIDRPWMKFYPAGIEKMMSVPEVSLGQYMRTMCRGMDLTVMHYYGTDISWNDFFRMVDETAHALRSCGVGKGDQVPVMLRAVPEFLVVLLAVEKVGASLLCRDNSIQENAEAISKAGAKLMFAHDFITKAEVDAYSAAGVKRIITVDPFRLAVREKMPAHVLRSLEGHYTEPRVSHRAICPWNTFIAAGSIFAGEVDAPLDPERPLYRCYTSGSTGPSKQVIHSAKTMLGVICQMSGYGNSDDFRPTWLVTILPPALVAVTVSMLLVPMTSNRLLILDPFVDVYDIDLEMMRYKPNTWPLIPMFMEVLMNSSRIPADYDMSHLLACGAGAEATNNAQIRRAQKFLEDHNCHVTFSCSYGQSEAGSNITFPAPGYAFGNGNVGIPMPLCLAGVFRGDRECSYNMLGEICIAGPGTMLGYDNEEATSRTLVRHADGNIWLHTGDTGYINEDGVIFTLGRGMAKRYHPDHDKAQRLVDVMLENLVADANIPGLKDLFFVTLPDKEHEGYHVPYMYAVLEKGYTVQDIESAVYASLEEYQQPVEIIQIPERPFYHFKTNRLHLEAPYARY